MSEGIPPPDKKIVTQAEFNKLDNSLFDLANLNNWLDRFREKFNDFEFPDADDEDFIIAQLNLALSTENFVGSIKSRLPNAGVEVDEKEFVKFQVEVEKSKEALANIKKDIEDIMSLYEEADETIAKMDDLEAPKSVSKIPVPPPTPADNKMESVSEVSSKETKRGVEQIKSDINEAKSEFEVIVTKIREDIKESDEYKKVVHVIGLINECNEQDAEILSKKLETYLTGLWKSINALKFSLETKNQVSSSEPVNTVKGATAPASEQVANKPVLKEKVVGEKKLEQAITAAKFNFNKFLNDVPKVFLENYPEAEELYQRAEMLFKTSHDNNIADKKSAHTDFVRALSDVMSVYKVWNESKSKQSLDKAKEVGTEPTVDKKTDELSDLDIGVKTEQIDVAVPVPEVYLDSQLAKTDPRVPGFSNQIPTLSNIAPDPDFAPTEFMVNKEDLDIDLNKIAEPIDKSGSIRPRQELFEAKSEYRKKEEAFNSALKEHYENQNLFLRMLSGKKVLGIYEDLPESLEALRQEYREARALYASSLDTALLERANRQKNNNGNLVYVNKGYDSEAKSTKVAFARRFILKPQERQLAMQETNILSEERSQQLKRIMGTLSKHKWLVRGLSVTAAGVVGGLSGGVGLALAGASWQAGRIAASAGAGIAANKATRKYLDGYIETRNKENLDKVTNEVLEDFSVGALASNFYFDHNDLDDNALKYGKALLKNQNTEKTQRSLGMAAAVVAGGTTGFMAGSLYPDVAEAATADVVPENLKVVSPEEAVATQKVAERIVETNDPSGRVVLGDVTVRPDSFNGVSKPVLNLSNIKFGANANPDALSGSEKIELTNFVKVKTGDYISANPNIAEAKLEELLFEKVSAKFSSAPWWSEAKFTKLDIGEIKEINSQTISKPEVVAQTEPVNVAEVKTESIPTPDSYQIKSGDTFGEIIEDKFKDKLDSLPKAERGAALDALYERLNNKPDVLAEMGVKSKDVDMIYAGDEIKLDVLESELDKIVESQQILRGFKTGSLTIEPDAEVRNIPIKVADKAGVDSGVASAATAYEAKSNRVENLYTDIDNNASAKPSVGQSVEKANGPLSGSELNKAISNSVKKFEDATYDPVDKWLRAYSSPFEQLKGMTLKDFSEFKDSNPEELKSYLTKQNIKYDTYLAWVDKIDGLTKELPSKPSTTIEDLVKQSVLKEVSTRSNPLIKNT